jgi:uncharacterized protein YprB with RNaseH-like and TPR domain
MIGTGNGKKRDQMPIKDELKLLKKERDARDRSRTVRDRWQKIDRDGENLTTKEKLERLISLTRQKRGPAVKSVPAPIEPGHREPVQLFENPYTLGARYGQVMISLGLEIPGKALAKLSHDAAFEGLSLDSALFLDLETTGLAGGTGTLPFLVGMGYYRDGRFNVAQYFLSEMGDEGRMLCELGQFFREMDFKSVVTYNGKAFDMPLLETRFALQRERFPLAALPHLDFLFSARHLWKHKVESCRLFHLAREIVRADRDEDIPGAEIPIRYFQYIRSGDFSLIEPILYHNQEDILSLLGVVIEGALLFDRGRRPSQDEADAMDLVGIGRLCESAGDLERSVELFEKSLEGDLSYEVSVQVRTKLGRHFKKNRAWDKAVPLWQGAAGGDAFLSCRELAMYYEHREKNYEEAIRAAEEGLASAMGVSPQYEQDFRKRLERLKDKVRRRQEKCGK